MPQAISSSSLRSSTEHDRVSLQLPTRGMSSHAQRRGLRRIHTFLQLIHTHVTSPLFVVDPDSTLDGIPAASSQGVVQVYGTSSGSMYRPFGFLWTFKSQSTGFFYPIGNMSGQHEEDIFLSSPRYWIGNARYHKKSCGPIRTCTTFLARLHMTNATIDCAKFAPVWRPLHLHSSPKPPTCKTPLLTSTSTQLFHRRYISIHH